MLRELHGFGAGIGLTTLLMLGSLVATPGCFDSVRQPIDFNHALHIEQELDCIDCHQHYETTEYSGLPRIDVCLDCHDEDEAESTELKKLAAFAERGEQVPWQRVYVMPDHVFYSHRRHIKAANIECKTCHGDIAKLTSPPTRPLVDQSMDWCLDCHEENFATTDCIHCHR